MGSKYKHVFSPIRVRGVDFKNRLEMAPPSPNLASKDGKVTREFVDMFRSIASGGVAVIHIGNSIVDISEARDEERQLDLSNDDCILPLTRFVEALENFGALASLEINHNGKDSQYEKTGRPAYSSSSAVSAREAERARMLGVDPIPTIEMTHEKIKETVEKYAMAAYRCKRAGMKMCMIHGGHGNLISQFSSPLYNKRTDEYGGSLENRARFTIEVLDRVRAMCGEDFVIEMRISADEIHPDGMHFDETLKYIALFKDKIDILHVSAGLHAEFEYMRNWYQNYMMDRMYNVHYAEKIKKAFPDLLVTTVGSIMNIDMAEDIIASGKADFVAMCRPILADPLMPKKYATGHGEDYRPCIRCQYCGSRLMIPAVINCAVNPLLGEEDMFPLGKVTKAEQKKKVAVVGGGPAGIQALLTLCERGHDVTLYEKNGYLGGSLVYAIIPSFKQDLRDYLDYLINQVKKSPARVLLNTEATSEILDVENYDAVIIAVGAEPTVPDLPGIDKPHVHWAPEADAGEVEVGDKIVIIGAGAVGIEAAIDLKEDGKNVTVIEMLPDLRNLRVTSSGAASELTQMVRDLDIPVRLNCKLEEVTDNSVRCQDTTTGETLEIAADTVLLAIGVTPRYAVADSFRQCADATEVFVVGDAAYTGNIGPAVKSAFRVAAYI
ncbi:MAG: FAD-dependent oxidoreductase [Clostridiales bacterium]|jgi:2,4-dienoyl-CoA reductase-like NADH-dependent reductase (Old Yellow Enzyme family)/thioredoxin reductase|nr:FAD-dependent oxidoreductase [Clostridiales bacterium]